MVHHQADIPGNGKSLPHAAPSRRWIRWTWLPIPVLLTAIAALWIANPPGAYESPYLLMALNFVFSTVVSLFVAHLISRSFRARSNPGLLMLGCGVLIWGIASLVGIAVDTRDINAQVTIHNLAIWFAALCHLTGVILSLRPRKAMAAPDLWRATAYALALCVLGLIIIAAHSGLMPTFFVQGRGGTPLRYFVLSSAIVMFLLTAVLLKTAGRASWTAFTYWYSLALILLAAGLFGVMIQTTAGSFGSWTSRSTQYLGGAYMLVAAIVSVRETRVWEIPLGVALEEAQRQYEMVFQSSNDGIVMHELVSETSRGNFIQANDAICRMLGYTADEMRELTPLDLLTPEQRSVVPDDSEAMQATGVLIHEKTLLTKDGRCIPTEISTRVFEHRGRQMVISTIRDITERKRAEKALRESEYRLAAAVKIARLGQWEYDPAGGFTSYDEVGRNMFGFRVNRPFSSDEVFALIHPDDQERVRDQVQTALAPHGTGLYDTEYRILRPDGTHRWLIVRGHAQWEGEPGGRRLARFIGTVMDITDRKRAEESILQLNRDLEKTIDELRYANHELEMFNYSVSHDLKSSLAILEGFATLLLEEQEGLPNEKTERYVRVIQDTSRKLQEMLEGLLGLSRVGRRALQQDRIHMDSLAQDVLNELRCLPGNHAAEVIIESLPPALGDPCLIRQVLINLLSNAMKFSRENKNARIEVTAETRDGMNIYHVRDNGAGFDMRYAGKLFGVFQRLHREEEFEGNGLGLAICRRILERHGGGIWAESTPKEGAVFSFTLPRVPETPHGNGPESCPFQDRDVSVVLN